jgi:hypothetical protein
LVLASGGVQGRGEEGGQYDTYGPGRDEGGAALAAAAAAAAATAVSPFPYFRFSGLIALLSKTAALTLYTFPIQSMGVSLNARI